MCRMGTTAPYPPSLAAPWLSPHRPPSTTVAAHYPLYSLTQPGPPCGAHTASVLLFSLFFLFLSFLLLFLLPCPPELGAVGGMDAAWLSSPIPEGLFFKLFPFFLFSFILFLAFTAGGSRGSPPGHAALSMSSPPNSYSTGSLGTATATVLYALHLGTARQHGSETATADPKPGGVTHHT